MNTENMKTDNAPVIPDPGNVDQLLLNIDGYEGPIDVLLDLARSQKVDMAKISILQLVRQYLDFVERAKLYNLELAAEYLVMAAWLAYLKSRLFLPKEENSDEPSAAEMAQALQFQLRRLEAMQKVADELFSGPTLGDGVFARGQSENTEIITRTLWDVNLFDILKAYGDIKRRNEETTYDLPEFRLMSMDNAMGRMTKMLGHLPRKGIHSVWTTLHSFMPEGVTDRLYIRSAMASMFTAGLELAKQGKIEFRQDGLFRPIYMRACDKDGDQS